MEVNRNICALKTTLQCVEKQFDRQLKDLTDKTRETTIVLEKIALDLRLRSFFQVKDDDQLRKLHFLLFINTELGITSVLESDCSVGHVVGAIPRLSTRVYFYMTYRYGLFKYLIELIELGPIMMVLELFPIVDGEVKSLLDYDRYRILKEVLVAVTLRLIRLNCNYTMKKVLEVFGIMMLHFKFHEKSDEDAILTRQEIIDNGYKFLYFVRIFHQMTKIIYGTPWMRETLPLYKVIVLYDPKKWYSEFEVKGKDEIIREFYEMMYFKCREMMTQVDLDMYLTWHEVELDGRTLQLVVGEEVFYLRRLLEEKRRNNPLPTGTAELIRMLEGVTKEPLVVDLKRCDSNAVYLEEVIEKIDTFDKAFLKLIEQFLEDNYFCKDAGVTFIRKLFNKNARPNIDLDLVKKIIALILQTLDIKDILQLYDEFLEKCGVDHFMVEQDNDFRSSIKQICSLYTKDDIDSEEQEEEFVKQKEQQVLQDVAVMAFHATKADLKNIIREGCLERNEAFVIIKVLDMLKPLCIYKHKPYLGKRKFSVMVEALKEFLEESYKGITAIEKDQFANLMIALSNHNLMESNDFLSVALLPLLNVSENTNWLLLTNLIKLFKDFYVNTRHEKGLSWAIVLVQFAQLLEESRWTLTAFSSERVMACEQVIDTIEILIPSCFKGMSPDSLNWVEIKLSKFTFLTRSYFVRICPSLMMFTTQCELAELMHRPPKSYEDFMEDYTKCENSFVVEMSRIILCSTQKEMYRIVENFAQEDQQRFCFILNLLSNSISFISNATLQYSSFNADLVDLVFNCLGHLVNKFLNVLQRNIDAGKLTGDAGNWVKYINRIIIVLKLFPEHLINTYQFNVIKFLMEELPVLKSTTRDFENSMKQLLIGLQLLKLTKESG